MLARETRAELARQGELAALRSAEDHAERAGLDPHRATCVCYTLCRRARVAVLDLFKVDWSVLDPVWAQPLVTHNATFDLSYLAKREIEPTGVDCTLQAVRLLNGPTPPRWRPRPPPISA